MKVPGDSRSRGQVLGHLIMFCGYNKSCCAADTLFPDPAPKMRCEITHSGRANKMKFAFHFCTDKLATLPPNLKHIKQTNQKQTERDGEAHRNLFYF